MLCTVPPYLLPTCSRPRRGGTRHCKLPDNAQLPQPPLVGVLPREGELPVREAVQVVLGVVDELLGRPALLPERGLGLVECLGPAAAHLAIG
jgi:hypothetical protein